MYVLSCQFYSNACVQIILGIKKKKRVGLDGFLGAMTSVCPLTHCHESGQDHLHICYNESVVAEFVFDIRIEFSAQEKHRYPRWKHGLRGQTASEVVFDLRFELLDLKNLWIHTHIAKIGHSPWGQVLVKIKGSSKSKEAPLMLAVFQKTSHSRLWLVPFSIRT